MTRQPTNWAGNIEFSAARYHRPTSLAALQQVVSDAVKVRALGTGHSFSRIADTTGDLVSVADLPVEMHLDAAARSVRVSAGVRYGEVATYLLDSGFALHNLASLPHITVAGACVTGTHGSGDANRSLAAAVSAVELVTADGDVLTVSRAGDPDRFPGFVVSLGALGVLTALTLDVVPAVEFAQDVYDGLSSEQLSAEFDRIFGSAYSVSVFTGWGTQRTNQLWLKRRADAAAVDVSWLDAVPADGPRHPIPGLDPVNCTEQLGVPGPWHERLPHFRLAYLASSGAELQSEFLLPRQHAADAIAALDTIGDRIAAVVQISEVRTIAADDLWLSPCYHRDTVGLHFTWVRDPDAVAPVVAAIEERLAPFAARPHWAKVFSMEPAVVQGLYERFDDFRALMQQLDPKGKFANAWVEHHVGSK